MNILTSNVARWIYFGPVFLVAHAIINFIAIFLLMWVSDLIFPINGPLGYIIVAMLGFPFVIFIFSIYIITMAVLMNICPIYEVGSRIMIAIFLINSILIFYMDSRNYLLRQDKLALILEIITILYLLRMSIKTKNDY